MTLAETSIWAFGGTAVLMTVYEASHGLGWSRLNLPLLFGSAFVASRSRASVIGLLLYLVGGWLFGLLYERIFAAVGLHHWSGGLLLGLAHGVVLLVVVLPMLPLVHPRMASEYDAPTSRRRLEPPGFLGLNYGLGTPITTLIGHAVYGLTLGLGYLRG